MCSRGDSNFYPSYLETGFCFWQLLTALSIRVLDFEKLKSNYRLIRYAFVLMYTITQDDITNCLAGLLHWQLTWLKAHQMVYYPAL